MRAAIVLSALFGATALALPTPDQDQLSAPQLSKVWKDGSGVVHEDYTVVENVVAGQAPASPPQPQPQVKVEQHQSQPQPQPQHQPQPQPQAQPQQQPQQKQSQPSSPPSSSGNDLLDQINKARAQWDSTLTAYTWSDQLKGNSQQTAQGSEGGGQQMVHTLNPGSMGQCIAEGTQGDFLSALKMWMCEIPKGSLCNGQGGGGETGHAEIFMSKSYSQIGCVFQGKMWTCDFH